MDCRHTQLGHTNLYGDYGLTKWRNPPPRTNFPRGFDAFRPPTSTWRLEFREYAGFRERTPSIAGMYRIALQALAGNTERHSIQNSIDYLLDELPRLRTPISLGWTLLGLGAWGLKPSHTDELVMASLRLQERHGPYSLPSLAILLCAAQASQGLDSIFSPHMS